jgi:hypothetical protein
MLPGTRGSTVRYGVETMCIAGGRGLAAILKLMKLQCLVLLSGVWSECPSENFGAVSAGGASGIGSRNREALFGIRCVLSDPLAATDR